MSSTTYGNMTNRIGLGDDNNSFSEFSILGQTRPSTIPSIRRGIDAQVEFNPTGGTAIKTGNGISFPGVGVIEGEGLADTPVNITTASLKIKIPNDIKKESLALLDDRRYLREKRRRSNTYLSVHVFPLFLLFPFVMPTRFSALDFSI